MKKKPVYDAIKLGNYKAAIEMLKNEVNEERIVAPEGPLAHFAPWAGKDQEHFLVLTLNGQHQPIQVHVCTIGLVNRTVIHPREVFRCAIADNAVAIIVAHNHPSGCPEPSQEDIEITKRLKKAGEVIGIDVLDHIVIAKGIEGIRHVSLLDLGII